MQLLTTQGYKNIEDCVIGEQLFAYDIGDGHIIINTLLDKQRFSPEMFEDQYSEPEQAVDENGNPLYEQVAVLDEEGNPVFDEEGNQLFENGSPIMTDPVLLKTKEEVFEETYGEFKFYLVNGTYTLFKNQSVWANMRVVHASDLQIGDVLYNDQNQDVIITSLEETVSTEWWRLNVSGDHSYIADNLSLHNASRYWVGGGSSQNWNATANTNWGSASGTQDNASVPTSTDDVIFDGAGVAGNSNSTISATITVLSLTITTGYTSTMTHNSNLTLGGNWTFVNTYTIAGTSRIIISAASTITSNGTTWNNILEFQNNNTKTLNGNLTLGGNLVITGITTLNRTTTEILTLTNGLTINNTLIGNCDITWTGGTWTQSNSTYRLENNLTIAGNVTFSGANTNYGNGTMTYVSGTVTTTGNTLNIRTGCTLNTNGVTWNNITSQNLSSSKTITLTSNLSLNGLLTISEPTTINRTTAETVTISGGMTINAGLSGTAEIIWTGGTWSQGAASYNIANNITIAGNVTFSGANTSYGTGTLIYSSGTVTTTGNTFNLRANCTLNTNPINWNNLKVMYVTTSQTYTLTSNLNIYGVFSTDSTAIGIFNKSGAEIINIYGTLSPSAGGSIQGTADVYLLSGSTWNGTSLLYNNLYFNGNSTVTLAYYQNGTMTYLSGVVTTTGSTLNIRNSCTLNTSGITWNNITSYDISKTITLTSNLSLGGLLTTSVATTINRTTAETVTIGGGMTINATLSGTADVYLTGGTWTGNSSAFGNNLFLNGNITVSASVRYQTGTLKYLSGSTGTSGSQLVIVSGTIDTNGIIWNSIGFPSAANFTIASDFTAIGNVVVPVQDITINATNNARFITDNITGGQNNRRIFGTAEIVIRSLWACRSNLQINCYLDGNVEISGDVYFRSGTLTYVKGNINSNNGVLNLTFSGIGTDRPRVIGFNKCKLKSIIVGAGATFALYQLPVGSEDQILQISSSGGNYTIEFTDTFEKIARNVAISGATLSRPMQLLVTTNARFNTNRSTNGLGIRYYNQLPNGFAENTLATADRTLSGVQGGLWGDPCFQRQG